MIDPDFDDIDTGLASTSATSAIDSIGRLWLRVVLQAMSDATLEENSCRPITINGKKNRVYRDQARAWIFAPVGVTATRFKEVCEMAGLDPTLVRRKTKLIIESGHGRELLISILNERGEE